MSQRITIESPCHADWNAMDGDARKRFCGSCKKHVHNLSEMTRREAQAVTARPGKVCVRFRTTPDGRVAYRPGRLARWGAVAVGVLAAGPAFAGGQAANSEGGWARAFTDFIGLTTPDQDYPEIMGEMAIAVDPRAVANLTDTDLEVRCTDLQATIEPGSREVLEITWGSTCTIGLPGEPGGVPFNTDVLCSREGDSLVCEP